MYGREYNNKQFYLKKRAFNMFNFNMFNFYYYYCKTLGVHIETLLESTL